MEKKVLIDLIFHDIHDMCQQFSLHLPPMLLTYITLFDVHIKREGFYGY